MNSAPGKYSFNNENSKAVHSFFALFLDLIAILIGYFICTEVPYFNSHFSSTVINFLPVFTMCLMVCSLTSFCFDFIYTKSIYTSTSYHAYKYIYLVFRGIFRNNYEKIDKKLSYSFFLIIVKIIFIPLMIQFSVNNFFGITTIIINQLNFDFASKLSWSPLFNNEIYPLLLTICFFIDTTFYLFGYLIYNESLGNKIRSVETSFLGWISALLCYPPLFVITANFFPINGNDYPFWLNSEVTAIIRIVMVLLIIVYTLSTINLGWKCSNLTNRGIVSKGAYSIIRHPAYIAKNLFWWISLIPIMFIKPIAIFYMIGLSGIYFVRALTEERHLYKDPDYIIYCKKVKYRFIPKIF